MLCALIPKFAALAIDGESMTEIKNVEETLEERGSTYGHFRTGAHIMQDLKYIARSTQGWNKMEPFQREALDMILHKIGRLLNGDPNHVDSWHDIAGYATLVEKILNGENP